MTEAEYAARFLRSLLSKGPRLRDDVYAAAKKRGISETTLHRGKKLAKVISVRYGYKPVGWYWELPGNSRPIVLSPIEIEVLRRIVSVRVMFTDRSIPVELPADEEIFHSWHGVNDWKDPKNHGDMMECLTKLKKLGIIKE